MALRSSYLKLRGNFFYCIVIRVLWRYIHLSIMDKLIVLRKGIRNVLKLCNMIIETGMAWGLL